MFSLCPPPGGYPSPRFFPRSLVPGPFKGVPQDGVLPVRSGQIRTPQPGQGRVPPSPRQNSRANTCYATGGMPLAFTQEDFLFLFGFPIFLFSLLVCMIYCELKICWKVRHIVLGYMNTTDTDFVCLSFSNVFLPPGVIMLKLERFF